MWKRSSSVGGAPLKSPVQKAFRKPAWGHTLSQQDLGPSGSTRTEQGRAPGCPSRLKWWGVGRRACPRLDGWGTSCVLPLFEAYTSGVAGRGNICQKGPLFIFFLIYTLQDHSCQNSVCGGWVRGRAGSLQTSSVFSSRSVYIALDTCSVFHVVLIFSKDDYFKRFHWVKLQRWLNKTASCKLSTFWTTTHKYVCFFVTDDETEVQEN